MLDTREAIRKALKRASRPLSTAGVALTIDLGEMAVHRALRTMYTEGLVERRIVKREAVWKLLPERPPVREPVVIRQTESVCPKCKQPLPDGW